MTSPEHLERGGAEAVERAPIAAAPRRGPVVLVTGAAGGIGLATARAFAERGGVVVVTARDQRRAAAAAAALDVATHAAGAGASTLALALDVTDPHAWRSVVERVHATCGRLDVLVNNAGVVEPGRAEEVALESVQRQVDVNLLGVVHGCRAVLPLMRERRAGVVVNVASLAGIVPTPHEAIYCATKHAVRGYSLALREELRGSGVAATVVSCGSVATAQLATELRSEGTWMSFVDPPLSADEVASAIVQAASGRRAEVLVPLASGVLSRVLMAWPRALLALMPLLRRIGERKMARLRRSRYEARSEGLTP